MKTLSHSPLSASYITCQQRENRCYIAEALQISLSFTVLMSSISISSLLSDLASKYIRRVASLEPSQPTDCPLLVTMATRLL